MNILDIVLLLPLIYGFYSGYNKGLIKQLTAIVGIVAAILLSFKFSDFVAEFLLQNNLVQNDWSNLIGLALTFILILIVIRVTGNLIRKTTQFIGLGFIEKILGGVFGALKVYLICLVLLYLFIEVNRHVEIIPETTVDESYIYPYYKLGSEYIISYFKTL